MQYVHAATLGLPAFDAGGTEVRNGVADAFLLPVLSTLRTTPELLDVVGSFNIAGQLAELDHIGRTDDMGDVPIEPGLVIDRPFYPGSLKRRAKLLFSLRLSAKQRRR